MSPGPCRHPERPGGEAARAGDRGREGLVVYVTNKNIASA